MLAGDMLLILGIIRASLPGLYLQQTEDDAMVMAEQWASFFGEFPTELVTAAVQQYCFSTTDRKNFPAPSDIMAHIEKLVDLVKQCSAGCLIEELDENAVRRYPLPVREYINRAAAARFRKINGTPFRSRAQLASHKSDKEAIYDYLCKCYGRGLNREELDFFGISLADLGRWGGGNVSA